MDELESLSHTKWECKYHVVFIPKGRRKVLYGQLREHLGEVFRRLAEHRESRVLSLGLSHRRSLTLLCGRRRALSRIGPPGKASRESEVMREVEHEAPRPPEWRAWA